MKIDKEILKQIIYGWVVLTLMLVLVVVLLWLSAATANAQIVSDKQKQLTLDFVSSIEDSLKEETFRLKNELGSLLFSDEGMTIYKLPGVSCGSCHNSQELALLQVQGKQIGLGGIWLAGKREKLSQFPESLPLDIVADGFTPAAIAISYDEIVGKDGHMSIIEQAELKGPFAHNQDFTNCWGDLIYETYCNKINGNDSITQKEVAEAVVTYEIVEAMHAIKSTKLYSSYIGKKSLNPMEQHGYNIASIFCADGCHFGTPHFKGDSYLNGRQPTTLLGSSNKDQLQMGIGRDMRYVQMYAFIENHIKEIQTLLCEDENKIPFKPALIGKEVKPKEKKAIVKWMKTLRL